MQPTLRQPPTDLLAPDDRTAIGGVVAETFRGRLPYNHDEDWVTVDRRLTHLRLVYGCWSVADRSSPTRIELSVASQEQHAWIGNLFVAAEKRGRGIGTAMADAAEELLLRMAIPGVTVFPLRSAVRFWQRRGYQLHPRQSRVLLKSLGPS